MVRDRTIRHSVFSLLSPSIGLLLQVEIMEFLAWWLFDQQDISSGWTAPLNPFDLER